MNDQREPQPVCPVPGPIDWGRIDRAELHPVPPLADDRAAVAVAAQVAAERQGESMLLSWYDRDRDFESPQHASECHLARPGVAPLDVAARLSSAVRSSVQDGDRAAGMSFDKQQK
ncbi:MAG: AF1514 family protein [Chromatiaceae bacterium]